MYLRQRTTAAFVAPFNIQRHFGWHQRATSRHLAAHIPPHMSLLPSPVARLPVSRNPTHHAQRLPCPRRRPQPQQRRHHLTPPGRCRPMQRGLAVCGPQRNRDSCCYWPLRHRQRRRCWCWCPSCPALGSVPAGKSSASITARSSRKQSFRRPSRSTSSNSSVRCGALAGAGGAPNSSSLHSGIGVSGIGTRSGSDRCRSSSRRRGRRSVCCCRGTVTWFYRRGDGGGGGGARRVSMSPWGAAAAA